MRTSNVQRLIALALLLCGSPCMASMRKQRPAVPPLTFFLVPPPEPSAMLLPLSAPRTPAEHKWNFASFRVRRP